ncbi:helix-turn-helix domain-containing protein [Halorubrum luteum]
MSRLLPSLPDPTPDDRDPRVVGVNDEEAGEVLSVLGSETAREILSTLYEEPATTSEVADELDTSLQNAQYHLGRLSEADLVDVVGTAYSEKGREMNVYAPADEPVVLFAGAPADSGGLKAALKRLLGGYGILGLSALVVQRLLSVSPSPDDAVAPAVTDDEVAEEPVTDTDDAVDRVDLAAEYALSVLEPGVVFFLGAALVFTAAWLYWHRGWVHAIR